MTRTQRPNLIIVALASSLMLSTLQGNSRTLVDNRRSD